MKSKYNLYIAACLFSVLLISCDLTKDLDDYQPINSLPAETAISDQSSAELALTGVYSILQQKGGANPYCSIMGSTFSGINGGGYGPLMSAEDRSLMANNPITDGSVVSTVYSGQYTMINRANWVINGVEKLTDNNFVNTNRRTEIVGEAKILRAIGHFYLLRLYGQFYDVNSEYGINVRLEPARDANPQPRISVGATYEAVLKDLDDGIAAAPSFRARYYVNKTFAKGLKAKVLLYMGRYAEAAALAKDVMENSGSNFGLAATFNELFDHRSSTTLLNRESLFSVYTDDDERIANGTFWAFIAGVSNWYYDLGKTGSMTVGSQVIKYDQNRIPFMATGTYIFQGLGINGNMKFAQFTGPDSLFDNLYYLRMAEMYLIYAEAAARSTNSVPADALTALNAIRIRSGATIGGNGFVTYPSTISYAQFLEAVRIEKMMELGTEFGEEWYDMVRYDYSDGFGTGFQVSNVKPTATNSDKFILPIPAVSIKTGAGVIKQNPSY